MVDLTAMCHLQNYVNNHVFPRHIWTYKLNLHTQTHTRTRRHKIYTHIFNYAASSGTPDFQVSRIACRAMNTVLYCDKHFFPIHYPRHYWGLWAVLGVIAACGIHELRRDISLAAAPRTKHFHTSCCQTPTSGATQRRTPPWRHGRQRQSGD